MSVLPTVCFLDIGILSGHGRAVEVDRFYVQLGRRIRAARTKAQLRQDQLGQSLGLSRTSVTNIEQGRQRLQVHHLALVSEALRVPIAELVDGLTAEPRTTDLPEEAKQLDPAAREWVRRVAARLGTEKPDETSIQPGKTKSTRASSEGGRRRATSSGGGARRPRRR
jgi:transcriptional regulator with XRE-family HTH domain